MKINVLGFGLMARQIASLFYLGGFEVTVWNHRDVDAGLLDRNIKLLRKSGLGAQEGTLRVVRRLEELEDCFTIESIVEDIAVKKEICSALRQGRGAGYVTNSSSLSPDEIGPGVGGLHFFNPILMKVAEVYDPPATPVAGLADIVAFLAGLEFEIIRVSGNRGYLGNMILFTEISNFFKLVEVYRYDLDSLNAMYGKLYNERDIPNIVDLVGVDVSLCILKNLNQTDQSIYVPRIFEQAVEQGVLGKKNKTTIKSLL